MRATGVRAVGVALLLCGLELCADPPAGAQRADPVLVLVAANVAGTDIGSGKLRSAYQSQTTELHGLRLVPFNLPLESTARRIFDEAILGLTPDRVGAFWVDQRIRHSLVAPRTIPTPELLVRVVASMRGAIGYVQMNPSLVPNAVRVLTVDGRRPTDPNYPLHAN